jgi:hypothetical protein
MKKYLILLACILVIASCNTDDDRPSLSIPNKDAQIAELVFTPDEVLSPFYYLIQAGEIVINWGDNSRPKEYVYLGEWSEIAKIKPIQYTYQNKGNYSVNIRTSNLFCLDFSRGIGQSSRNNQISSLNLYNCTTLAKLYCKNQPINGINLTECTNLMTADFSGSEIKTIQINKENELMVLRIDSTLIPSFNCDLVPNLQELGIGNRTQSQAMSNMNHLKRLKKLILKGDIDILDLNLTHNDSIRSIKGINTNTRELNLTELNMLDSISLEKCKNLNKVILKANTALKYIALKNNVTLDAKALNDIFTALPQATGTNRTIALSGNLGDTTCDRTIATRKGWSFESSL